MKSIALIGFMGSGKSTIGPMLASRLGMKFVETDALIEQIAGKSVASIFAEEGEPFFRRLERSVLQTVTLLSDQVISCGGGATADHRSLRLIRMSCTVVLLEAEAPVLYERISGQDSRPLALNIDTPEDVCRLMHDRNDAYSHYDFCVDTGAWSVPDAVDAIVRWVQSRDSQTETLKLPVKPPGRNYCVAVGSGILSDLGNDMRSAGLTGKALLFSNENVSSLYGGQVARSVREAGFECSSFLMTDGEEYKTLRTAERAYLACSEAELERESTVIALGGGVVGDVAGFVAGTYMRGVNLVQAPTTLLAMVDSSIGGKTAVNMPFGKNMVGVFYQPRLVVADLETLQTLTERDYRAGMVELVKHGLILNPSLLDFLLERREMLTAYSSSSDMVYAVAHSCAVKADVVEADETDQDLREILNVGHTIGHALELVVGYGRLRHGEAVALGIMAETEAANAVGITSDECLAAVRSCLRPLTEKLDLPEVDPSAVCRAMVRDKKRRKGQVLFSVIEEVGTVRRRVEIECSVLERAVARLLADWRS